MVPVPVLGRVDWGLGLITFLAFAWASVLPFQPPGGLASIPVAGAAWPMHTQVPNTHPRSDLSHDLPNGSVS